jgi:predicted GIY-YIG superfamily endonuclease
MNYYVYVIQNNKGKIYIGQTSNLEKRLLRHNQILASKKISYTYKNKSGDWKLIYKEMINNRKEAIIREKYLKSHHGRDEIKAKLKLEIF